jgi:hypothetical protein
MNMTKAADANTQAVSPVSNPTPSPSTKVRRESGHVHVMFASSITDRCFVAVATMFRECERPGPAG